MKSVILVTHNKGKLAEANAIAKVFSIRLETPGEVEKLEIQDKSITRVSEFSAKQAFEQLRKPLIVDDSGLFVNALKGFPGVYSANVFPEIGMEGIIKLLDRHVDRSASFQCSISYYDGKTLKSFVGRVDGTILKARKGERGFGYDPIFAPDGYDGKSFGELGEEVKNNVSHRRRALEAFFKWYSDAGK